MYVLNLLPLTNALFQTNDWEESSTVTSLSKTKLRGLGGCTIAVRLHFCFVLMRWKHWGKWLRIFIQLVGYLGSSFPPPQPSTLAGPSGGQTAAVKKEGVEFVDLTAVPSDDTSGLGVFLGVAGRTRRSLRVRKDGISGVKGKKGRKGIVERLYGKVLDSNSKGKDLWSRSIVCGLRTPEEKRKGEGKEKIDVQEMDKAEDDRNLRVQVYDEEGNEYAMYVETDGGFTVFPVLTDTQSSDSGYGSGPAVPMTPCTSSEWDPNSHCFLLRRKKKKDND